MSGGKAKATCGAYSWELSNVVTAQQVAFAFPPDTAARESYLQALSALPASLLLLLIGVVALAAPLGWRIGPGVLAGAALLFAFGLGAAPVLANYLGATAAVLLGPLAGAALVAAMLGWPSLLAALPAALLPAAFLSPRHTGLLVLLLVLLTGAALVRAGVARPRKG